jgi:hypothetical protein
VMKQARALNSRRGKPAPVSALPSGRAIERKPCYFKTTALEAEPPKLLRTVTFCGLTDQLSVALYLPPPSLASVPMICPDDVTRTCIVAFVRVLVVSTRSVRFWDSYSARWIATVSPAGVTVSVAERDKPFSEAATVAVSVEETDVVLTVKLALVAPAGIVTLDGTVTAGAPELARETVVGADEAALTVTVPREAAPPVTLAGFKVNEDKAGVLAADGVTFRTALRTESPK